MFRHVVLFTWTEEATGEQRARVAQELGRLPAAIPEIRAYTLGADAGVSPGNHEFAIVADFDGVDDFLAYRDHPLHQAVIAEHIKPIVASRAAVQFEVQDSGGASSRLDARNSGGAQNSGGGQDSGGG